MDLSTENKKRRRKSEIDEGHLIYVSSIPNGTTLKKLHHHFKKYGEINYIELDIPSNMSVANGFGIISYVNEKSAITSVFTKNQKIGKRFIKNIRINQREDVFFYIEKLKRCRLYISDLPFFINDQLGFGLGNSCK